MGWMSLGKRDEKWEPRKGLEGPFFYAGGRVLYYDPREGQYWDPRTDFYIEQPEIDLLNNQLLNLLRKQPQ